MEAIKIGSVISELRKRLGWTQKDLAERLNVSSKTVSKWESGHGFPEITQFPVIAELFGVTVDYLMTGNRKGITVAGTILLDLVKTVSEYPELGKLTSIKSVIPAVGGAVPNVAINLAKIDRSLPISVIGRVGDDEHGHFVEAQMKKYGINTQELIYSDMPTGFTDVISLSGGERTFFSLSGANDGFSPEDINISALSCKILHIGYIMLLKIFDSPDNEYETVMARFLHSAREKGIKTSFDVVTNANANFADAIIPALKYCDYCIINELECCGIWGIDPYEGNGTSLNIPILKEAMKRTADIGIHEKLIVHSKELGICYDVKTEEFTVVPSLKLPVDLLKGSTGAGDAYCAGCLYGLYNGYSDEQMLRLASGTAACSLFAENSVDGMRDKKGIEEIIEKYGVDRL